MKIFPILLCFVFISMSGISQVGKRTYDGSRIEALKIAYLTKKLSLSPEEAQRFWPVYNNYSKEMREARHEQRKKQGSVLENEENMLRIRKKYQTAFSEVLAADKVDAFFRAEKEFGGYIQKELAERRQQRLQSEKK